MKPSSIREILKLTQGGEVISFAGGLPAPQLFPTRALAEAAAKVLAERGAQALQYSTTEGVGPLRDWLAASFGLASRDGVQIVSGSQQGLDLVAKVYFDEGDLVAVAAPTYMGALRAFDAYGVRYAPVATDAEGLVPDSLEAAFRAGAKMLYLIPNFDNPTGASLALARRHALVALARRYGVPILEDDPYGELRFEGERLPQLRELAPELVIHAGTFSKTVTPGLRLAWLVAAPEALAPIVRAKQAADLHSSSLLQLVAYELLHSGLLDEQLERVRAYYRSQREHMLGALERHFPAGVAWTRPQGGMFLWVTLPAGLNATELALEAVREGVAYVPGEAFFAAGGGENTLRLSYSVASPEQIETGVARLGALFARAAVNAGKNAAESAPETSA